jgi:hypothetical protein
MEKQNHGGTEVGNLCSKFSAAYIVLLHYQLVHKYGGRNYINPHPIHVYKITYGSGGYL